MCIMRMFVHAITGGFCFPIYFSLDIQYTFEQRRKCMFNFQSTPCVPLNRFLTGEAHRFTVSQDKTYHIFTLSWDLGVKYDR